MLLVIGIIEGLIELIIHETNSAGDAVRTYGFLKIQAPKKAVLVCGVKLISPKGIVSMTKCRENQPDAASTLSIEGSACLGKNLHAFGFGVKAIERR